MGAPKNNNFNPHGRPKGALNKITLELKEMILGALDDAGGRDYLCRQAKTNPGPFLTLVGKVLPLTIAGDKNNPLTVNNVIQPASAEVIKRYEDRIIQQHLAQKVLNVQSQ